MALKTHSGLVQYSNVYASLLLIFHLFMDL